MKRVFVIMLCLVMFGTSFSVPKYAYADDTVGSTAGNTVGDISIITPNGYCCMEEILQIKINDFDQNKSPDKDTIPVTIRSTKLVDQQEVLIDEVNTVLYETDSSTGEFVGDIKVTAVTGSAIQCAEILGEVPCQITATYIDTENENSTQKTSLPVIVTTPMVSGAVINPDATPAVGGVVDVVRTGEGMEPQFIRSYPVSADGSYRIPPLEAGNYSIRADHYEDIDLMPSRWLEITVDSQGKCYREKELISNHNFQYTLAQFGGTVKDKDNASLTQNEYEIEVRSTIGDNGYNIYVDRERRDGTYQVTNLDPGEYAIRAVSKKADNYDSCELYFEFRDGKFYDPSTQTEIASFDLKLTDAQVTGSVYYHDERGETIAADSGVVVFDSGNRYVYGVDADEDGNFVIGGLMPGYRLQAAVGSHTDYDAENTYIIEGDEAGNVSINDVRLFLKKRELTVEWVNPFVIHYNDIGVHLNNVYLLNNDWSQLTATISGTELENDIVLPCTGRGESWGESSEFFFAVTPQTRELLDFGKYTIRIKNGENVLPSNNNDLDVIQRIELTPGCADILDYQLRGIRFDLDAEEIDGQRWYPWSVNEELIVKVIKADNTRKVEHEITLNASQIAQIPLVLPALADAQGGRRDIEVYSGTQLLANGGFDVGVSSVGYVTTNEGSDEVSIWGDYLGSFRKDQLRAELWLGDDKLADNYDVFEGDDVRFKFDYRFSAGVNYILKVFINNEEKTLPQNGTFQAAPRLSSSISDYTQNITKTVTIKESDLPGYNWSKDDKIRVNIYGDGAWDYNLSSDSGLEVTDDSIIITLTDEDADGRAYHLNEGVFYISVSKTVDQRDIPIGFTETLIAYNPQNVLCGKVVLPNGDGADGVYIDMGKEYDDWGTRLTTGPDGSFCAHRDQLRGSGDYRMTAVPAENSVYTSSRVFFNVQDDDFSNFITITLNDTQVTGTVSAPSAGGPSVPVSGEYVDVIDPAQDWERVNSTPIRSDGTFKLGGLIEGKRYLLQAGGPWDLDYVASDVVEVIYNGNLITNKNLELRLPQIIGSAMDPEGNALKGDEYDVHIRALGDYDSNAEIKTRDGKFIIGNLGSGTFAVAIMPRGMSLYARSKEQIIIIGEDGTASVSDPEFYLTAPSITGVVKDKDGNALGETDGYVEVWKDRDEGRGHICSIPLINGTYQVGGLPEGEYELRAGVSDYETLFQTNSMSPFIKVTVGKNLITQNLTLTSHSIPRILWVNHAATGYDRISAHILNFKDLNRDLLQAEIVKADGTSLDPVILASGDDISFEWEDYNTDQCELSIYVDDKLSGLYGDYRLKLTYGEDGASFGTMEGESDKLRVAYSLNVSPRVILPEATSGMELTMYIDDLQGGRIDGLWTDEDTLTVDLVASDSKVYSGLSCAETAEGNLTVKVPTDLERGQLPYGWTTVRLYKNGSLFAFSGFEVGVPVFERVDDISQHDDRIAICGRFLAMYDNEFSEAEILDINGNVVLKGVVDNFEDDRLNFRFEGNNLPAGQYNFRLRYNNQVVTTLAFYIAPWLISQPHAIAQGTSAELLLKKTSAQNLFQWDTNASLNDLMVRIGGPAHWYEIRADKLSFEGDNLKVTIDGTDGELLLSQPGFCWLEVYKNDRRIGYSRLTIGQDVISAIVFDPKGQVVPNARVRITNLNQDDYNNREFITDAEGRFYVSMEDLPRDNDDNASGEYSFLVIAPAGSEYATTLTYRNINAENNNVIDDLTLATTQISGNVTAGGQPVSGGRVELQKDCGDHWEFLYDFDLDGADTFHIGGLEAGTYYIKVHEAENNNNFVTSDFYRVTVEDKTVTQVTIALNPVQITGTAFTENGTELSGNEYNLEIQSADLNQQDINYEWRIDDENFRIGALKPGRYKISIRPTRNVKDTQSYDTLVVVKADGTVDENQLTLSLTQPLLTGNVKAPGMQNFYQGYVEVYNGTLQNLNHITTVELDDIDTENGDIGDFRIGGIPAGYYYIRALLWNDKDLNNTYSQSALKRVYISSNDGDTGVQLSLVDNVKPRIRCIENPNIGYDRITFYVVNLHQIKDQDLNKLQAQIFDAEGKAVSELITGEEHFCFGEWYDGFKDEGDLSVMIEDGLQLPVGEYSLKVFYDGEEMVNDFNSFYVAHDLQIYPYSFIPVNTGLSVINLDLDMERDELPWDSTKVVQVRLYQRDGSFVVLEHNVAEDNTLTAVLPEQDLPEYYYMIHVYVDGVLMAKDGIAVSDPEVYYVCDVTEEQQDIRINGENLSALKFANARAEIYLENGTEPVLTVENESIWIDRDDLVIGFNERVLPVGTYRLELYYNKGDEVELPGGGAFHSVDIISATPSYLKKNETQGKSITLQSADGMNAPWSVGDTLRLTIRPDNVDEQYSVVADPAMVTEKAVTFTIADNLDWTGHCSIDILKEDDLGNEIFVGYAHFFITEKEQLSGKILLPNDQPAAYSYVYLRKNDDEGWYQSFEADAEGNYGIYDVEPGEYTVYAAPRRGLTYQDSEGFALIIDDELNSNATTNDFELRPGRKISGIIRLPEGVTVPEEGLKGWVMARNDNNTPDNENDDIVYGTEYWFRGEDRAAEFSIIVPAQEKDYTIQTWCSENGTGLVNTATFYKSTGSVSTIDEADVIHVASEDISTIDFTLKQGVAITGTISLPDGRKAPKYGINVDVIADDDSNTEDWMDDIHAGVTVTIPENESSVDYTIIVPPSEGYTLEYIIDSRYLYMDNGFYQSDNVVVLDREDAAELNATSQLTGMDMTLVRAKLITGTITLPQGYVLPEKGIGGFVAALIGTETPEETDDFWYGTGFGIEKGTSTEYAIKVPANWSDISVDLWSDGPEFVNCTTFYSTSGNVFSQDQATLITPSYDVNENINFVLQKGKAISGTVTLPAPVSEGERGINLRVIKDNNTETQNDNIIVNYNLIFAAGESSRNYTVYVPAVDGYQISYAADPSYGYERKGFYSTQATVYDEKLGTLVNATNGATGINLAVSLLKSPVCNKAEVSEDGTSVILTFTKTIDSTKLSVGASGFGLIVGETPYEVESVVWDDVKKTLTLKIKADKIFKDYKDIQVTYDPEAGVKSVDGAMLDAFSKAVTNNSTKEFSVLTNFVGSLINKKAVITVTASGEAIVIKDNGVVIANGTGTVTKEISEDGPHAVEVKIAGRKQTITYSFTKDELPPSVTIKSPTDKYVLKNDNTGITPVIEFSTDAVGTSRMISLNGKPLSATISGGGLIYTGTAIREAGHYVLTATAKDAAGNVKTESRTFDIIWDDSTPIINISGVENGVTYKSANISISLSSGYSPSENSNLLNYKYTASLKLPNGTIVTKDNGVPALTGQGTYLLEVVATNPGYTDKTSSKSVTFTIDNVAPTSEIKEVTNGTVYNRVLTPVILFTDEVATQQTLMKNAVVTLKRNGSAISYNIGDTISQDGDYILTAKTQDTMAQSSNVAEMSFTIDQSKPVVSISGALNGGTYKDQDVTLTFKTNEGTLTVIDGANKPVALDGDGKHTFTCNANEIVTYKVIAKAEDAAGNATEQQLSFTIDKLPVNIVVNGITEGMLTNSNPEISFTSFEGTQEKAGTTVTIDGVAFSGGRYSTAGTHTLIAKYFSNNVTYTKTLHFTIDKATPTVSVTNVTKNTQTETGNLIAKAGDKITVKAMVTDNSGISEVILNIGAAKILMSISAENCYEGTYNVEGGSFDPQDIIVIAKDKAGNLTSKIYGKTLTIDNTKPTVSLITTPAVPDGMNGVYVSPDMRVTLTAGPDDTIVMNGEAGTKGIGRVFTPSQGTNILQYYAIDLAGNVSDTKYFIFKYDSNKPANVTLSGPLPATTSAKYLTIKGSVSGEGAMSGSKVLVRKFGQIIAKAGVKSDDTFEISVELAEGTNTITLTALDYAGNESQTATTLTRTLDSTAPILIVDKTDDTHYTLVSNEDLSSSVVKLNGVLVSEDHITATPAGQSKMFAITTPEPIEGTNVLNVTAFDLAGNMGTGSYTSTYIPPNTEQKDLPLNDNASMDVPAGAFMTSTQILVKTVDVNDEMELKPLGAAISFEFLDENGDLIDPDEDHPLLIKNYIGVGLTGVVLMHVDEHGTVDQSISATVIRSTDDGFEDTIAAIPVDTPYYVIDTGYLIFRTSKFSSYQAAQDDIAPVLTVTTTDFIINKADADNNAGKVKLEGTITDSDDGVKITEVVIDGKPMNISGIAPADLDKSFSINLTLTDGNHEVTIKAADQVGNTATVIKTYQVDVTAPELTVTPAVSLTNKSTVDLSINTSEMTTIVIDSVSKGSLDGDGVFAHNLVQNTENIITVTATDAFGNTTTVNNISVTNDSKAPTITINNVSDGDVKGNNVEIEVIVNDLHTPNTTITLDGNSFNPSAGPVSTEGQHTLIVSSTDTFGNTASRTVQFTIDKSVPVIEVNGAENDVIYKENQTLTISADNIDELIVTKATDNQAPVNVDATVTGTAGNSSLTLGTAGQQHNYKIVITARKTVGGQVRSASTTISLTVDRKNPVITSTTSSQTENAMINLTGTIDEAAKIYLGNTLIAEVSAAGSFTITGQSLNIGSNTFHVKAEDMAGNVTSLPIIVTRTEPVNNGGNNQGGNNGGYYGGGSGGAGGGAVPSGDNKEDTKPETDTPTTDVPESSNQTITEQPVKKGSTATATTTNTELSTAIADTEKDTKGVKTVTIELQEVKGAKTYTEILPVKAMTDGGADLNVQIVTPLGTVTVPGDMFASKATNKKNNIGISIATADKSKLKQTTLKAIGDKPVIQLSAAVDGKAVTWSNPNAPVTVAIPYKPTAAELKNPDHIVVWYIDGAGKVQTVANGKYDAKTGTVTFTTTHFSTYAVAYVKKNFKDISKLEAKTAIEFVASKGIMNGNTDTKFDPNGTVTRGEFIAYLMNTLNLTAEFSKNFADVKASDSNYNAIGTAMKLGILSGTSKSKFYPNELLTKEDMAVYTVLAMKLSHKTLKSATAKDIAKYSDAYKVSSNAVNSIAKLIKSGVMRIDGKKIYSKDNLTRAEVAEILYKIYKAE